MRYLKRPNFNIQISSLMLDKTKEKILYQLFLDIDDFMKAFEWYQAKRALKNRQVRPGVKASMSLSEMMTIVVFYHYSGYKCFQYYYEDFVLNDLATEFPKAISYQHFVSQLNKLGAPLFLFAQWRTQLAQRTGIYMADSKKLPVCDNRRISSNRVFKDVAGRGKSSTGWFYGIKAHLVINNLGEIVHFVITPANVSDNNEKVLELLLKDLHGKCFGDKGYLTKFFQHFLEKGIQIVTKIRKKMKNSIMQMSDKMWLKKRAIIESVNDLLMTVFDIDHTRHRNPWNAIIHTIAGLTAYSYYPRKPSVFIKIGLD